MVVSAFNKKPRLRFNKFEDEWHHRILRDVSSYSGERIESTDLTGSNFIGVDNLIPNLGGKKKSNHVPNNGRVIKYSKGDVLHSNIRPYLKKAWLADRVGGASADVHVIKPIDEVDPNFLFYVTTSDRYFNYVMMGAKGVKMPRGDKSQIMNYGVYFPSKPEQEKITDFLGSVDEKIEKLEKKKELFEKYKKGAMHQIFSQKIRFKKSDGSNYPDWEGKKLGEILIERKEYAIKGGDFEHISLTTNGVIPKSKRYERDFLVRTEEKKYKVTKKDDICYNPANLKFGVIARNKYGSGIFSPIYVTYEVLNSDVGFIEYFVTRKDFINYARKYEQGTVYERMAVGPEDFSKLDIVTPTIGEQREIASFLKSLDYKINLLKKELEGAKKFKKSLLQQMFV